MKKILGLAVAIAFTATAFGQGTILFTSHKGSGSGPVLMPDGTPVAGSDYSGQLYGGPDAGSINPIVEIVGSTDLPVYGFVAAGGPPPLLGYVQSTGAQVVVPGTSPNTAGVVQLRVWNNQAGSLTSWEAAQGVSEWGESDIVPTALLGGPNPSGPAFTPPNMPAFASFNLQVVPEPTTWALLGIGALALFFRRRK